MVEIIIAILGISVVLCLISLIFIIATFKAFYSGIGFNIILAYIIVIIYLFMEIRIYYSTNAEDAKMLSKISSGILGFGLYLLHYFHDEVSAVYRQRKTMTLSSIVFGMVLAGAWLEGVVKINTIDGHFVPQINPIYGMLIIFQASLLIYRVIQNTMTLGELSDHYGIKSAVPIEARRLLQRGLYVFQAVAVLTFIVIENVVSTPFAILISLGLFGLSLMYFRDPLSTLPIGQPIQALALIRDEQVIFLHTFSSADTHLSERENFGPIMISLGKLYGEIMQSQATIRSISTEEVLVMFENAGDDYLVMILKYRAPLVRRILKSAAVVLQKELPQTQLEFSNWVNKQILFRKKVELAIE